MIPTSLICILGCYFVTVKTIQGFASEPELLPALQCQPLFHGSASYYLPAGEDWRPGGSTLISVLMADQPLQFRTDPTGSKSGLQSVRLLYKCSSTDADFKEVLLESSDQSSTHCRPLRPFVLERLSASIYRLTLLRENGVAFEQALRHSLEFRLRLSFYQGELESASLFVFNFDALTKIPKYSKAENPNIYSFISHYRGDWAIDIVPFAFDAYKYLATQDFDAFSWNQISKTILMSKIKLLRQEFLDALHQSEPMVRNLLYLTVFYSRNCSDSRETPVVLATAGLGGTVGRSSFKTLKHFLLDAQSGMLHMHEKGFVLFSKRLSRVKGALDVCLNISVKGDLWPYHMSLLLSRSRDFSIKNTNSSRIPVQIVTNSLTVARLSSYLCHFPDDKTSSEIQLPAQLYNVSLACPVFCQERFRIFVHFEGIFCSSSNLSDRDPRPPCSDFFSVSSDSCGIDLIGATSRMHAGNYTIIAADIKYTYRVSVVSLPVFSPEFLSSETIDFNPTFATMELTCGVNYYGIEPIEVRPQFRILQNFIPGLSWIEILPHLLSGKLLDGDPGSVALTRSFNDTRSDVKIEIKSTQKEAWWVSWKAAFKCSAPVTKAVAQLFGLPEYEAQASWNLRYNRKVSRGGMQSQTALPEANPSFRLLTALVGLSAVCLFTNFWLY